MQELKDTQTTNVSQWIFGKRLQIFGSQQELVARTDNYHIHQDQFQGAKRYDSGLIGEINNQKDLKQVYKIFNSLLVRFRFNTKNLDQTSSKSRNELKNKKHLKDVENQFKSKIRRINEIMRIPKEQDEHWKNVLNHKNVIQHVIKSKVFLKKYLETNFELIKEGGAHLKNANLPKELQIYLCILAMDILKLINMMIHLLYPFLQQQNNSSNNKVEFQEKIFLQNALENANESLQIDFLKSIDIQRFLLPIKRLANQIKGTNYPFKVWISAQQIRQNYLVNKFGVSIKKFHPTAAKELMLFWMQVYNEHFNEAVILKHESVCLKQVFSEYKIMFNYYLIEETKKQGEACQVVQYLDLIQKIWVKIDLNSASNIFWQQLQLALTNKKITLPADFVKNSRDFLMDIVNNIIRNFKKDRNEQYLQKLKQTALNFSMNLLNLEYDQNLTEHYFLTNEKQIRLLLTQRSVLDQNLMQIRKKLEEEKEILKLISTITKKMVIDEQMTNYMMAIQHEKIVIDSLYAIYRQDHALINEIKYFLLLSRCLSNRSPSQQELQTCLKYYQSQRKGILTKEEQISSDQVNRLRFGLLDCIKNFTFQLVLNIKLNKPSEQLDKLKKIIYKLLKIYKQKRKIHQRNTKGNNAEDDQQQIEVNSLLLRRSSSVNIDANWFHMEAEDLQGVQYEDQNDDFTMNYLKKLFELRVQMILKSIHELQIKEHPYREEFLNIKSRIYIFAANSEKDQQLRQDVKKLPQIQFDFIKGRYFEAWNELRKLKDIEGVNKILEKAWDGKRNLLKLFVIIFLKYKEPIFQTSLKGKDLEGKQIQQLMDEALKCEHRNMKIDSSLKQNIINSIRILDCIQKVYYLKKELMEQDEQISNMQEAKNYKLVREETKFNLIQDKVQIFAIMKNDVIIMRKYIIKLQPHQVQQVFKKLRKLTQFNRNISLQTNKQKDTIVMKIDEIQNSFESYPKLIKFLIQTYLQIIQFCHRQLNFQLYPLILHNHFKIYKKNDHNITLKMNPYQGILLNIISSYKDLKLSNDYKYPKYPFIQLADQLSRKFEKDKVYDYKNANEAELYAFKHLITQMKALSMEIQSGNNVQIAKSILKCPYFWSSADKLFEIVEFKERYQSIVNIEESRRKENEKIRQSLNPEQRQNFTYWPPEKKHPSYKLAYGYNKTDQVYFSIEGLLERQAFEQDIGNFKGKDTNQKYKFHGYAWSKDKTQIQRLVKMVAQREKKKGSNTSFYDKTFNSFQNQIRNLRNLSVHYIYDSDQKKEIDLEDKLRIFETYFPKLFVFLYRWRPFLGKDYINEIKPQKILFLKQLFCKEDNSQIITRLSSIKELQTYNIKNNNSKNYLLQLFNYDFARVNSCEPCKILCNSLKKQNSFWGFLQDIKRQNYKQGKDMTYNLLFWDHDKKGCNGMVNLIMAYFNVTQRNQFTTEQFAHVKSSLIMMQIQKDRLQKKIKKKLEKMTEMKKNKTPNDNEEEDNSPGSDSESVEIQKNRQPVDKRFKRLNARELDALNDQLLKLDYVCKYFIYQLEMEFPYLFHDLRNERYQWDERARQFPKKE